VSVVAGLPEMFAPGGEGTRFVNHFAAPLAHLRLRPSDLVDRLRGAIGSAAATLATWAAQVLGVVADGALAFFFMAVTMFFVLVHWTALAREAERLIPINPRHTRKLLRELSRLGRQTFVGNFGTAVVQGVLGGIGYWLTGVPQPAFFGALTAAAALVPVFGTLLVWVPAGVILLVVGHPARGAFELIWGAVFLVGVSDYVVRPRLVGAGESMSTWITFVALFGGVKLFGVVGLLLGPITVGLAVSALRIYGRTRRFRLGLP
jgi:predicted PurR-regulated permease PerM